MEKFDINKYNELLKDDFFKTYGYHFLKNGDKEQIFKGSNNLGYEVKISKKDSPLVFNKTYFENLNLKKTITFFYSMVMSVSREYDENGKFIREINEDENFKFSIEDLEKKIIKSYQIDIMDSKVVHTITRSQNDIRIKQAYYLITVKSGIASYTEYLIDGNTGETLFIQKNIRDFEKDIIEEYLKSNNPK